jgi:hypothetical protein
MTTYRKQNRILIYEQNTDELKFDINLVSTVSITTTRSSYTDTAKITFPNKLRNRSGALDLINIGDKVEIFLGYFPTLLKEFTGFINYVNRDSPLEIELEDESFLLKRISLPKTTILNASISQVINRFYDGETNILDAVIGDIRIAENATLVKVLDLFKSKYGILSNFQDGVLNINTDLVTNNTARVYLLHVQENVPIGGSNLQFQKNSDLAIISHGVSIQRNGTKIELFATYKDNVLNNDIIVSDLKPIGVLNTMKVPDLSKEALESLIRRRLPLLFYTGVSGDITTFGYPSIRHGDTVKIQDDRTPEKNGFYRVNKVVKEFTPSAGYKQKITLGLKTAVS